ncbi:Ger(x)C family spore germination protein [Halalkalibacter kiskunsagensis]|uniref:Ger(X)C family spore germination protein n=1 Tax=Halalkalibacter kiskunsagensis TaxID=1548599 RepID=A0ABV6KLT6_9BACI
MKWTYIICCFLLLIINSGCTSPNLEHPVIEDLGMIGVMGFDYVDAKNVKVSITLPQPSQDVEEPGQQFSSVVKMPHEAIMDMSTLTEKTLTPAQLRVLLFSEEYARKEGLWKILENLYRDPQVGTNIFIAVVKGTVEDILTGEYKDKPDINDYLIDLLTPRTITAFSPFTTIHDFIYRNTDEVSDPSTPYIESVEEGSLKITKVAIFKNDHMVDTMESEEAKLIEAMKKRKELPDFSISIPAPDGTLQDEEMVTLKFVNTRYHVKVNGDLEKPKLFIYLYVRGSIVDYEGKKDLATQDNRIEIEKKLEKQLEDKVIKTVRKFQKHGIDPVGFGESFRIQNAREWKKEKWIAALQRADITTHVETRIISTGTIR